MSSKNAPSKQAEPPETGSLLAAMGVRVEADRAGPNAAVNLG
jgi:hypothetical protein